MFGKKGKIMHIRIKKEIAPAQFVNQQPESRTIVHAKRRAINIDPNKIGVLIVGIGEYPNPTWRLYKPVSDAISFFKFLENMYNIPPQNIRSLYNVEATKLNIITTLRALVKTFRYIVFYFSGHGFRVVNADGDGGWAEGIVCYDHAWARACMVLDEDIRSVLCDAKRAWVVVDACHSAGITRGDGQTRVKSIRGPDTGVRLGKRTIIHCKDIVELAACQSSEVAYELDSGGIFTTTLIDLLQHSPCMSFLELQIKLREKIRMQTPQISAPEMDLTMFEMN
jgi:hypothetical protein